MLKRMRSDEEGFTLIELLVVILIIGILAAIALPSFLGQQTKGQDAAAKSDARNTVSQVESCFADQQDYQQCAGANVANLGTTGLNIIGTGTPTAGQVLVTSSAADGYVITAASKSGNTFSITKTGGGPVSRTCTVAKAGGGCKTDGGSW